MQPKPAHARKCSLNDESLQLNCGVTAMGLYRSGAISYLLQSSTSITPILSDERRESDHEAANRKQNRTKYKTPQEQGTMGSVLIIRKMMFQLNKTLKVGKEWNHRCLVQDLGNNL